MRLIGRQLRLTGMGSGAAGDGGSKPPPEPPGPPPDVTGLTLDPYSYGLTLTVDPSGA